MKILMTGGTGLIGLELGMKLSSLGHSLVVISRNSKEAASKLTYCAEIIECDLNSQELSLNNFKDVDAVINLAGESVDGRWTEEKKSLIMSSRKNSAQNLLKNCPASVKTIITASAQGFYGDRGNNEVNEDSFKGEGFLADVCEAWESEFKSIKNQRVVILRIGLVLSKKGGALKKLVSLFQKNLGAVLGNGSQWMSYISLYDLTNLFIESLLNSSYQGVINAVNNNPVTNTEFTCALSDSLKCLQLPKVPEPVLKIVLGEMSKLVLASLKVKSRVLEAQKFNFQDQELNLFLKNELKSNSNQCSVFYSEQFIASPIENVFNFFADAKNLEKITPEILNFKIISTSTSKIQDGTLIDYRLKIHGFPVNWKTKIEKWSPPNEFFDIQLNGPYKFWEHRHSFKSVNGGTLMIDEVRYKLPFAALGRLIGGVLVDSDIQFIFDYRRKIISELIFRD